ncbi:hypothetical protein THIOM_001192 [Candidatus Thiomargarita nelsonii]|uniref:Uncharacterized protein n=1 Tax=Candidatus Thiomargarita nelsonii TaxID=1003181 RepID=A0A176S4Q1_9GAMM|nr:hypothetical protein THIOM_001192 [Candidatus Thiomargarita nelsonii]
MVPFCSASNTAQPSSAGFAAPSKTFLRCRSSCKPALAIGRLKSCSLVLLPKLAIFTNY